MELATVQYCRSEEGKYDSNGRKKRDVYPDVLKFLVL